MTDAVRKLAPSTASTLSSMPAVMVTGTTVTENSPFSSLAVDMDIATNHYAYTQRDG